MEGQEDNKEFDIDEEYEEIYEIFVPRWEINDDNNNDDR